MVRGGGHHSHSRNSSSSSSFNHSNRSRSNISSWNYNHRLNGYYSNYNDNGRRNPINCNCSNILCCGVYDKYIFIIVLFFMTLIIGQRVEPKTSLIMDNSETRLWGRVYPTFNKELYINNYSKKINIYQVPLNTKLSYKMQYNAISNKESLRLTGGEFVNYAYYLNKDSHVNIKFNGKNGVNFYIIKGDTNFNSWKYNSNSELTLINKYSSNNALISTSLNIIDSDIYYFIFDNSDDFSNSEIEFSLNIDRNNVDLTDLKPVESCIDASICNLSIQYGSSWELLISSPQTNIITNNSSIEEETYNIDINFKLRIESLIFCYLLICIMILSIGPICNNLGICKKYESVLPITNNTVLVREGNQIYSPISDNDNDIELTTDVYNDGSIPNAIAYPYSTDIDNTTNTAIANNNNNNFTISPYLDTNMKTPSAPPLI